MKEWKDIIGMCLMEVYERGEQGIVTILNCKVPSEVLLAEYGKLKNRVEDIPQQEKEQMWQFVHSKFPGADKTFRINACKIIHTIGALI